jgi:hypothetical protein
MEVLSFLRVQIEGYSDIDVENREFVVAQSNQVVKNIYTYVFFFFFLQVHGQQKTSKRGAGASSL